VDASQANDWEGQLVALQVELDLEALMCSAPSSQDPVEFAWRVHSALDSWTGKVDTKASITLAIEGVALGFVVSLSEKGRRFYDLHGASSAWFSVGLLLLLAALLAAALVVMPQLNRRSARRDWRTNTIYFGHLRHWDPDDLAQMIAAQPQTHKQLARQLVAMADIAWRKHSRLQVSLLLLMLASGCLLISTLIV
jgi:hypothetical protein